MYYVELSERADRFLNKLDKDIRDRIEKRLKNLRENPVPSDAKFIERHKEDKIFRYRIGDYRALYKIIESKNIVLITKIDKREKVYKK